jgi:hypothetical protein
MADRQRANLSLIRTAYKEAAFMRGMAQFVCVT